MASPTAVAVAGSDLFVSSESGTVGEYTTSGQTVNASLITGLDNPVAIAISGSDLFIVNAGNGTVGEYTTSGSEVNASLITGLVEPKGIAVSGSASSSRAMPTAQSLNTTLLVLRETAPLITGLNGPWGSRFRARICLSLTKIVTRLGIHDHRGRCECLTRHGAGRTWQYHEFGLGSFCR